MPKHPKGIRPWKGGWQAYVRTRHGLKSKSFPLGTPLETMKLWRRTEQIARPRVRKPSGTFQADIQAYLARVTAMPTYWQKTHHLKLWADALGGHRPRHEIATGEIEQAMQRWLRDGTAPNTVRLRRGTLAALYTRLDGKGPNVVSASAQPRQPPPKVRGIDYAIITAALDGMRPTATRARLRIIAWTGLPPAILKKITPADIDWQRSTVRVVPRRKGAGAPARELPLLPNALAAFKELRSLDAFGEFEQSAANAAFQRACKRLTPPVTGVRLYDLRHSFAVMMYRVTRDLATTARFLLHASTVMTERYAQGATVDVDNQAITAVHSWIVGENIVPESRPAANQPVSNG